jgi:hypothetical protein
VLNVYGRLTIVMNPIQNSNWRGLYCVLLCLVFTGAHQVCAQGNQSRTPSDWSVTAGIAGNRAAVIDKSFSSLAYSGLTAGVFAAVRYQKGRSTHELRGGFTKGNLETGSPANSELRQVYVTADYGWLQQIGTNDHLGFVWKAGAGLSGVYAKRRYDGFINNNESFELAASLNATVEGRYFFSNGPGGFSIANRICLPLVSFIAQPEFGREASLGSEHTDHEVAAFSSFFRVCNILSLEKELTKGRKVFLFYDWDFYQIRRDRAVKQSTHSLGVAYNFVL